MTTSPARLDELSAAENPALAAEREGEREVLLKGRLTAALRRLNEWMTED